MTKQVRETDKKLQEMAERLRLVMLRDNMAELMDMATENRLSPRELLTFLFSKEIEQREANRIRLSTMGAHFPRECTLEGFDVSAQPSLEPGLIRDLSRMEWLETAENVVLVGPPGVGKTHLAIGFGKRAIEMGYAVRFFSASNLLSTLKKAQQEGTLVAKINQLQKFKLLIIDELGYLPFSAEDAALMFQLISKRYESRSTIVTSNRPPSEWGLVFGDPTAATAILDRLLHHCTALVIQGDSYRLRDGIKGIS